MDNASRLVADVRLLSGADSHGRVRALAVLAQDELGKVLWVYRGFETAWNAGSEEPLPVNRLGTQGRSHIAAYLEAFTFGDDLGAFWDDYPQIDTPGEGETCEEIILRQKDQSVGVPKVANRDKWLGFYIDMDETGQVHAHKTSPQKALREPLSWSAGHRDAAHSDYFRMKFDAVIEYDSTHDQQWRLLSIYHPEEFRGFVARGSRPVGRMPPQDGDKRFGGSQEHSLESQDPLGFWNCERCFTRMEVAGTADRHYFRCPSCGAAATV